VITCNWFACKIIAASGCALRCLDKKKSEWSLPLGSYLITVHSD
jgi:hypothetical protein